MWASTPTRGYENGAERVDVGIDPYGGVGKWGGTGRCAQSTPTRGAGKWVKRVDAEASILCKKKQDSIWTMLGQFTIIKTKFHLEEDIYADT